MTPLNPPLAIVYECGNRILAHGPREDSTLAESAQEERTAGIEFLLGEIAQHGAQVPPQQVRQLLNLLTHEVSHYFSDVPRHFVRTVGSSHYYGAYDHDVGGGGTTWEADWQELDTTS